MLLAEIRSIITLYNGYLLFEISPIRESEPNSHLGTLAVSRTTTTFFVQI